MKFLLHHKVVLDILRNAPFADEFVRNIEALGVRGSEILIPETVIQSAIADNSLSLIPDTEPSEIVALLRGAVNELTLPPIDRRVDVLESWAKSRREFPEADPNLLLYLSMSIVGQYFLVIPTELVPELSVRPTRLRKITASYAVVQFN